MPASLLTATRLYQPENILCRRGRSSTPRLTLPDSISTSPVKKGGVCVCVEKTVCICQGRGVCTCVEREVPSQYIRCAAICATAVKRFQCEDVLETKRHKQIL